MHWSNKILEGGRDGGKAGREGRREGEKAGGRNAMQSPSISVLRCVVVHCLTGGGYKLM